MIVVKYVCMIMTILFGGFTLAYLFMGNMAALPGGIFLTALFVFLTYRADKAVQQKRVAPRQPE